MNAKRLAEIKARCEKATGGPWERSGYGLIFARSVGGCRMELSSFTVAQVRGWGHLSYLGEERAIEIQGANERFISEARQDIPDLLKALEESRLSTLKEVLFVKMNATTDDEFVSWLKGQIDE